MKTNLSILLFLLFTFSFRAQSITVGLDEHRYNVPSNAYFKDLNNELNKFEGIWKYSLRGEEFVLELKKIQKVEIRNNFRDYLIGEYSYRKDGEFLVNTFPLTNSDNTNIGGSYIVSNDIMPVCENCTSDERRFELYFNDPERSYLPSSLVIRYLQNSSPEKLEVIIYDRDSIILPYENAPTEPRVPYGTYVMVKQ